MQFVFHEKGANRGRAAEGARAPNYLLLLFPRSPFFAHSRNKDLLTAAADSLKLVPDSKWIHPFQDMKEEPVDPS